MKQIFISFFLLLSLSINSFSELTKEEKSSYLNIGANTALVVYGIEHWGYDFFNTKPHAQSEGWFEKSSKHGGSDKLGHAYTGHVFGHLFSHTYKSWGYTQEEAASKGFYSSILFTTTMELGDSFSDFGLSYEDMVANVVGATFGYYTYKYPSLGKKLDYRVDYEFTESSYADDFTTDYEKLKYILVFKAEGFTTNPYLEYLEFHLGYNIRGFDDPPYVKKREGFVGIGINLGKLLNFKPLYYYQIPKSYISNNSLD